MKDMVMLDVEKQIHERDGYVRNREIDKCHLLLLMVQYKISFLRARVSQGELHCPKACNAISAQQSISLFYYPTCIIKIQTRKLKAETEAALLQSKMLAAI